MTVTKAKIIAEAVLLACVGVTLLYLYLTNG